jgi:uncharacterized membrane protein
MGTWIFGVIMGLLSLFGLFLASRAHDQMLYLAGLFLFLFGIAFIFALIARHTGHPTKQHEH